MGEFGHGSVSERLTRSAATLAAVAVILGSTGLSPRNHSATTCLSRMLMLSTGLAVPGFEQTSDYVVT